MSNSFYKYIFKTGYRAEILIRLYKFTKSKKLRILSRFILLHLEKSTGVELSEFATIGNIKIAHGKNIVIGGNSVIGNNVTIYNGVTLGISGKLYNHKSGKIMQTNDYPTVEDNCIIYAGAKVLGNITIGHNSIVGANAVVLTNIPANSIVTGIPAKVAKSNKYDLSKF